MELIRTASLESKKAEKNLTSAVFLPFYIFCSSKPKKSIEKR